MDTAYNSRLLVRRHKICSMKSGVAKGIFRCKKTHFYIRVGPGHLATRGAYVSHDETAYLMS